MSETDDAEPENKDWTWVPEPRCDDCGFDAPGLDRAMVPGRLKANANTSVEVLARPDVRERPAAGVWSPLEYACHVRDVFRLYDYRLHFMVDQDDPHYPNGDPYETAVADRYRGAGPFSGIRRSARRPASTERILSPGWMARPGSGPAIGAASSGSRFRASPAACSTIPSTTCGT